MSVVAIDGSVSGSRDMTQNWFWGISTGWTVGWMAGRARTLLVCKKSWTRSVFQKKSITNRCTEDNVFLYSYIFLFKKIKLKIHRKVFWDIFINVNCINPVFFRHFNSNSLLGDGFPVFVYICIMQNKTALPVVKKFPNYSDIWIELKKTCFVFDVDIKPAS